MLVAAAARDTEGDPVTIPTAKNPATGGAASPDEVYAVVLRSEWRVAQRI
jgi:hypothetical protein